MGGQVDQPRGDEERIDRGVELNVNGAGEDYLVQLGGFDGGDGCFNAAQVFLRFRIETGNTRVERAAAVVGVRLERSVFADNAARDCQGGGISLVEGKRADDHRNCARTQLGYGGIDIAEGRGRTLGTHRPRCAGQEEVGGGGGSVVTHKE